MVNKQIKTSEKRLNQRECPNCGKKVNIAKTSFCPSCGNEIFTPVMDKKWSYKVVAGIVVVLILLYVIYLLLAPVLYFYIDRV